MGTLKDDIKKQSEWIAAGLNLEGYKLDFTIPGIMEVDRFFAANMIQDKPRKGSRLAKKGFGPILFSIGAYVGETIIKHVDGAEWITDDSDPMGELNVSMRLPNDTELWPMQRVMNRFVNGPGDSIYPYVHMATKDFTKLPFQEEFWEILRKAEEEEPEPAKPWWKFW
jgi:hypothetical protein